MRNSDAIIDSLTTNGVDTIFGIPGKQTLPLNKCINERDDIEFIMARHETNVSHQAWGFAETSGEMAATLVVPGPGDMNAMNGLKNAFNDCTPLLHIAVETEPSIRGGDGIHETPPNTYDNVTKENITVETPQSVIAELEHAISTARTAPKGPVRIGIPKNFISMDVEPAMTAERTTEPSFELPGEEIDKASERLASANLPVIIAGGGIRASNAGDELLSVAERLQAPVITTYKGKGTFPEDHPLSAGVISGGASTELVDCVENADIVLGVGTDFDAVWTKQWSYDLSNELIHITLDPSDVGQGYEPSVAIMADAAQTLAAINEELSTRNVVSSDGSDQASTIREAETDRMRDLRTVSETPFTSVSVLTTLREALPRNTIVTADAGGSRIWTLISFPIYDARNYVNPGSWASMGLGIPAAIGATVANPDQPVVAFIGEGGLMMCVEELHTIVSESLDVTVFVFNNNDYAIISEEAERSYQLDKGEYGWADAPLDCTSIAEGMGMQTKRAETLDEIMEAAKSALSTGPALVEIPTDPYEPQAGEFMTR